VVGVDEHQIAGVQLNRPPAGRGDVAVTEINGLARQFPEILHDHPRTLSVGARIDAHAHVHREVRVSLARAGPHTGVPTACVVIAAVHFVEPSRGCTNARIYAEMIGYRQPPCAPNGPVNYSDVELPQAEAGPVKNQTPGPVGLAVEAEVSGLAQAQLRPALIATAPAMARILDNPRAPSARPAAAKVLVSVMDTLHKGSAQGCRGSLALVRL
jgi:hypothetical protein